MTEDPIVLLEVALDEVEPKVVRRIAVPLDCPLDRLHLILQAAFGWSGAHLWEVRVAEQAWGPQFPDWPEGPVDAAATSLYDLMEETGATRLTYLYDFGDSWSHTVKIGRIREPEPGTTYPCLIAAEARCPPEDIGGPWGYEEFLDAIGDPEHERHEELMAWHPEPFNPEKPPVEALKAAVARLAAGREPAEDEDA